MRNRTGISFKKHKVLVTKNDNQLIYELKKPDTFMESIKYINTNGLLVVTGDFGNWVFCREFHPSANGYVSDGYWLEKLHTTSSQDGQKYDSISTEKSIKKAIRELKHYGYSKSEYDQVKAYFQESLHYVYDELDYTHFAYREYPYFFEVENVVFDKQTKNWLRIIFDGFDEICKRIKKDEENRLKKEAKLCVTS
jgi:hypothetical protein